MVSGSRRLRASTWGSCWSNPDAILVVWIVELRSAPEPGA